MILNLHKKQIDLFGLMGTEIANTANSAIECPSNLNRTFLDRGLAFPQNVWEFEKRSFDAAQITGELKETLPGDRVWDARLTNRRQDMEDHVHREMS